MLYYNYINIEEITQIHLEDMHKYELGPTQMLNVGAMMPYMNYTPRTLDELWDIYIYITLLGLK